MTHEYDGLQFNEVKEQILKFCSFSLGASLVENLSPSYNKLFVKLENQRVKQAIGIVVSYGSLPFGGIYDVSTEVELASKNATLQPTELIKIAQQAAAIDAIIKFVKGCNVPKDKIEDLTSSLVSYSRTATEINKCISYAGEVNDNASTELANIRKKIKATQKSIASKMNEYVSKNSNYLQDSIIAERNGRSVVLVKNMYKNTVEGLQYGSSSSGNATYIEPAVFMTMNNALQQAINDEKQEIQRILFRLSQLVKQDARGYLANVQTLGLLDSLFARGKWAKELDCTVATLSDKNLVIKDARHPLIDQSKVIANTYTIIDPVKTVLITGPNTGGKTVSLKIFGLFPILFFSGIPLPCKEAEIPLFDHVYYDIGDGQSITDDLSTFSSHISNISRICSEATKKSLVILDELGGATDPNDGQAIASAVLDYLLENEIYVVATTHFSKLKSYAKGHGNIMLASVEFDQDNLKPTYRYIENTIGSSNAIEIAKRYGLRDRIILSAYQFKKQQQSEDDRMLERLQKELESAREKEEEAIKIRDQIQEEYKQLLKEKEELQLAKESILEQARKEANEIVDATKKQSDSIIDELKEMKNYSISEVAKIKHDIKQMVIEDEEDIDNDSELKVGDYVRISVTNQKGEIVSIEKKYAFVNCDGVKIKASLANLNKTARPIEKKVNTRARVIRTNNEFHIECNLIGMRVEEAMIALDRYLDSALLANVPFVRIIHGVGTGALRTAVWNKLKKTKFIKKFEMAPISEGGTGATMVYLRDM